MGSLREAELMTAYAELAVTTNFSFLRGASHPQEMVATADALGLAAIGIADRNSFAGVVRAYDEWRRIEKNKREKGSGKRPSSFWSARASSRSMVSKCLPIRPTGPPMAGSAVCSRMAMSEPRRDRKANAI